jgi:hypothetical protein
MPIRNVSTEENPDGRHTLRGMALPINPPWRDCLFSAALCGQNLFGLQKQGLRGLGFCLT